jgi:hypothetical protein
MLANIRAKKRKFRQPNFKFHGPWPLGMNKKSFIKLLSAIMAGPVVSPLFARLPETKLKNWAGNFEYSTDSLYIASSVEQVKDFVKKRAKLKVLGTRHCFNKIADNTNHLLSLKPIGEVIALNNEAYAITVQAIWSGPCMSVWRSSRRSTRGEQPDEGVEVDEKERPDCASQNRSRTKSSGMRNSNSPETNFTDPSTHGRE